MRVALTTAAWTPSESGTTADVAFVGIVEVGRVSSYRRRTLIFVAARSQRALNQRQGFARHLVELRARRNLTQQALAGRAGVTARVVQRWESGRVFPNEDSLARLVEALDVSHEELLAIPEGVSSGSVLDQLDRIENRQLDLVDRLQVLQGDLEGLRYDLAPLVALAKRRTIGTRHER